MKNYRVLRNCNIFDTLSGTYKSGLDIVVENDTIRAIGRFDPDSEGGNIIDCTGKYVLPGLFECHSHIAFLTAQKEELRKEIAREWGFEGPDNNDGLCQDVLKGFIVRGITQLRDVGGPVNILGKMREEIIDGRYVGPDIFYAGPMLEKSPLFWAGNNDFLPGLTVAVDSKEDAEEVIKSLTSGGASLVKTFGKFDKEVLEYLLRLAKGHNLPVTNDPGTTFFHQIPMDLGIDLGIRCFEHAKSPWYVVLKDELKSEHDSLIGADPAERETFLNKLFSLGPESISTEKLCDIADRMRDNGVYFCLTLYAFKSLAEHPEMHIEDETQLPKYKKRFEILDEVSAFLAGEVARRGVRLLVGQDGWNPNDTLREMELMQAAGVSEEQIIKGATIYPAEWLGIDDRYGSVAPGRKANMLILDRNPLDDIRNIKSAKLVLKDGETIFESQETL
jgi:hypothetical protein